MRLLENAIEIRSSHLFLSVFSLLRGDVRSRLAGQAEVIAAPEIGPCPPHQPHPAKWRVAPVAAIGQLQRPRAVSL
jgi:hypothetical protein